MTENRETRFLNVNDRTLFDVDRTTTAVCESCGATREPGEDKAPECGIDAARAQGHGLARPKGCLNAHDPAHAPFPEGF